MKILLTFDTGYTPHAAVVIESIIKHSSQLLEFVVIYSDLSHDCQLLLKKHFENRVKSLSFYEITKDRFTRFKNTKTLSWIKNAESVLLRLFCDCIPGDDHILYLDCDMIVMDDVCKLQSLVESDKVLYAVTEYNSFYKNRDLSQLDELERPNLYCDLWLYEAYCFRTLMQLGMHFTGKYFCAGLMLINLGLWKKKNIGSLALDYIAENPDICFATDQDALNHVINGDYGELLPRWNTSVKANGVMTGYSRQQLEEAWNKPAIIHCAGANKPWHYMGEQNNSLLYASYRKNTPWPDIIYPDKTLNNILNKKISIPLRSFVSNILGYRLASSIRYYLRYNKKSIWSVARLLNTLHNI